MKKDITLEELIRALCEYHHREDGQYRYGFLFRKKKAIEANTLLEDNLGITGDDGDDLLEYLENFFSISFSTETMTLQEAFDLEDDQYLFHSEGFFPVFWKKTKVKAITVGDLHRAIVKVASAMQTKKEEP